AGAIEERAVGAAQVANAPSVRRVPYFRMTATDGAVVQNHFQRRQPAGAHQRLGLPDQPFHVTVDAAQSDVSLHAPSPLRPVLTSGNLCAHPLSQGAKNYSSRHQACDNSFSRYFPSLPTLLRGSRPAAAAVRICGGRRHFSFRARVLSLRSIATIHSVAGRARSASPAGAARPYHPDPVPPRTNSAPW